MRRLETSRRFAALTGVLVLAGAFAVASQARTAGPTSATRGGNHRSADVTFTKWLTSLPNAPSPVGASMAGVVGGDVGPGVFAGKVLSEDTSQPPFWLARALYGFNGSKHSFLAYNRITQNNGVSPATATIRGVVIAGWMTGAHVTGEYTLSAPCPIPTPDNVFGTACFQGTLHLQVR